MSTIVLTAAGHFWGEVTDKRRLLRWMLKDKVQVLKYADDSYLASYGEYSRSGTIVRIRMPLVVMLLKHFGHKAKNEKIPFSNAAVYKRDNNICQYWHDYVLDKEGNELPAKRHKFKCSAKNRTIDHVIPKSRGGGNTFENNVCCCRHCNEKIKKNHTPEEAGLVLIRKPFVPTREIGEFVIPDFGFNPNKASHKAYSEIVPKIAAGI